MRLFNRNSRKIRKNRTIDKVCAHISDSLKPRVVSLSGKWRIKSRIRLANILAYRNPQRYFSLVIVVLLLITSLTFLHLFINKEGDVENAMVSIPKISNTLERINRLHESNAKNTKDAENLIELLETRAAELDSLVNLPSMTREDSIRATVLYKQLKSAKIIPDNEKN